MRLAPILDEALRQARALERKRLAGLAVESLTPARSGGDVSVSAFFGDGVLEWKGGVGSVWPPPQLRRVSLYRVEPYDEDLAQEAKAWARACCLTHGLPAPLIFEGADA